MRGSVRNASLRTLAAFAVGLVVLGGILYVASTVDGRAPTVERIAVTHHLSTDEAVALTTASVEVVFSEVVDHPSAEAAFSIQPAVDGSYSWSGPTMIFTPAERLPLETAFVARIGPGVRDAAGNEMQTSSELAFATVGNPTVAASQPEADQENVPLDAAIVLEFSTLMDTASVEDSLTITPAIEVTSSWSGERLTLTPVEPLAEGTLYGIRVDDTARDNTGTPLGTAFAISFRTVQSGLEADVLFPADDAVGIAVTTPIALVFDRELDPATVDDDAFTVEPSVAGSLEVVAAPGAAGMQEPGLRILRFQPSGPLDPSTTYQVTLRPGLAGADASALAAPISWRFTTGAPIPSLSNQIAFLSERAGIANLWAMNPDGSGVRQLSSELSPQTGYALAPDGRSFVVGDGAVLVRQRADGGGRELLTDDGVLEVDPDFAPNGSEIAFARIDPATGGGLGLWTRPATGGEPAPITMPAELGASSAPTPSAPDALQPVLRAPRYSPDGAALAFVDISGRVGVLELPAERLTTAPFAAVTWPEWLADSSGLLLSGSPAGSLEPVPGAAPAPPLDPGTLGLSDFALGALRLGKLDRGDNIVELLDQPPGASRPTSDPAIAGRYLFVAVLSGTPEASGTLWLVGQGTGAVQLLADGGAGVTHATFGPQSRVVVASRSGAGIWTIDTATHVGQQLIEDGWLPRWLP